MSDIKSLFEKSKAQKVLSDASLNKVGRTIESADYVKEEVAFQNQVIPYINFSSASNFARYGSAEKYYEDSINYIKNEWPYDGSQKEKIEWQINASYLDRHIFENSYPRTTGYIKLGNDYGTITPDANGYDTSTKEEYIRFKGSSNLPTGSTTLREDFAKYNMYNTSSQGLYTTELNGNRGYSVEFWFKKDGYSAGNESQKQIFFDLWNSSSANEGRLKIEADMSAVPNVFTVNVKSGSAEFAATLGSSLDITGSDWHHYSFTFANSGSSTVAKLYVDGDLNDSSTATDSIGLVTGSMIGNIGAMITAYDSSGSANAGKLSGSLDDFRYWKSTRTEEEIGRNWFCQVDGGTNTDIQNIATSSAKYSYENPVDLGLYYKFNEGVINSTSIDSTDARVLDYSGRVTNGSWTGYSVGARFTGSAMVESSASLSEFQDPIIYSNHPSVITLLQEKKDEGRAHDYTNNANVYKSIPSWIIEEDQRFDVNQGVLQNLTQIMASYFDTLQLQIEALPSLKDNDYVSGSDKPLPFSNRLVDNLGLTTSEIFSNATDLEYLASKDDFRKFSAKLNETKNLIYQNVHNNLTYIYKSKGTEKSFRNLIRCFGVDDELVNINLYGSNVTFEILDNTENTIVQKRYASFSDSQNHNATVFQSSSATNTNSRSYISASDEMTFRGLTFESEVHFPKQFPQGSDFYNRSSFLTSSLFGCHASDTTNSWSSPDYGNFQVQSVRTEQDSKSVYFQLTGTAGSIFPNLTSSVFKDVYDDSRWLFALKIKPSTYPLADGVSGSGDSPDYDISFAGYNYVLDVLVDSFEITSSVPYASGSAFATANKRMFVGAHRTNFTGSVLEQSDVDSTSLRAWMDYIDTDIIKAHARDVLNFGPERPNRNAYITQLSKSIGDNIANIPQLETLALHWNFDNVTGSDGSGQFTVDDFSSGSVALTNRWGWLGPISKYQHTGLGYGFETSSTSAIDRKYVHSAQQQLPETLQSGDMVSIIDDTTNQIFSRDSRPVDYNFAFEKSMYRIISQDMLKYFATMTDFNNLIGAPINRYRQQYKDMENFRQLYFERIGNDPDFDKFVEYFKWIDSAIVTMLLQLAPASSRFNDRLRNMVESHVLERNKYWNKFPTLEMKVSDPEAGLRGITELTYPWSRGSAPLSNLQKDNCLWWSDRTKRQNSVITSGDSNVDTDRETIRLSNDFRSDTGPTLAVSRDSTATTTTYEGQAYAIRNFTKPYRFVVDESSEIHGGSNFPRAKKVEYTHASLNIGSATQLEITASDFDFEKDCDDIINPNAKERLETKVQNTSDSEGYKSGKSTILAPFSLFSSSVDTGYASQVASNFRANTEIANYHDDSYGDDKGIPMQGPFTKAHVGGRQHRHVNFREQTVADRPEAWNLAISSQNMTISSRTVTQPRATMIRDEYAKRALNLRNIKWGTGSFVAGNYRKDYEIIQTSDRNLNDRYFVKAEGQQPVAVDSPFLTGTIDYTLPRFDLTGTNDYIFVERFNAPGGQDVSSRGMLDWKSEQFAIYNDLNFRNLGVRRPLNEWYTEHSERFGIKSGSSVRELDYNTLASYHKVNRNPTIVPAATDSFAYTFTNTKGVFKLAEFGGTTLIGKGAEQPHMRIRPTGSGPFPSTTDAFAVSMWFTTTSSFGFERNLISRWESNNSTTTTSESDWRIYIAANSTSSVNFEIMDSLTSTAKVASHSGSNVTDSNWHHLLASYTRTGTGPTYDWDMSVMIDGNHEKTFSFSGVTNETTTTARTYVGAQYDDGGSHSSQEAVFGFGEGSIDELAIWYGSPIPSASYATLIYNSGCPADLTRTIGLESPTNWWRMGDAPGDFSPPSSIQTGALNDVVGGATIEMHYRLITITSSAAVSPCDPIVYGEYSQNYTCSINYDNWWVQHAIPQSAYQYSWVTASATRASCDMFGYVSNFSIPSGTTSTTQSALPFVEEGHVSAGGINADFAGLNTLINDPVLPTSNTLSSSDGDYRNTSIATINTTEQLNALNLHRNGPYQYPSWKQTRTGETPVARYHKNNNILSIGNEPTYVNLDGTTYLPNRPGSFNNFVEPPVSFKYKPLLTSFGGPEIPKIRSTYGNNKGHFSQGIQATQSIDDFIKIVDREDPQAYDLFISSPELLGSLSANRYSEVVYPREMLTGLAETRGRTNYAEIATVDSNGSASLSNGSNGIDRGPLLRRTYWRDSITLRNRISGFQEDSPHEFWVTGALPNSQGYRDGYAQSINGFGSIPLVNATTGSAYAMTSRLSGAENLGLTPLNFDGGELNSANFVKFSGYFGGFSVYTDIPSDLAYDFPTASAYYHHQHIWQNEENGLATLGLKWKVAELSGKNPWYDSYEDYSQDIRVMAKNHTIIPEFRISQHMDYYSDLNFRKKNDQFLTLDGASITSSANQITQSNGSRGFNEQFFNEYSNTDFQKYFSIFYNPGLAAGVNTITIKANAAKKLLPYHGFYPAHRTLQIASLFSQSVAPFIGGIGWESGQSSSVDSEFSGALAVQSLLQPYYAPGIMYNTIKSGIAVDWAAYTGSSPFVITSSVQGAGWLTEKSNYRIPFESILNPLGTKGIPVSDSSGDKKVNLLGPSYQVFEYPGSRPTRQPYFDIKQGDYSTILGSSNYTQYKLAVNNFFAEIPNFFLEGSKLKTIVSKKATEVQMISGTTYYMDIYLDKSRDLTMMKDYWDGQTAGPNATTRFDGQGYCAWNGRFFGPAVNAGDPDAPDNFPWGGDWFSFAGDTRGDPAYAPYTPPYFYGKDAVTIAYTADEQDELGGENGFNYQKLFERSTLTFKNVELSGAFNVAAGVATNLTGVAAWTGRMTNSSSLNLFGLFQAKETTFDNFGNPRSVMDSYDSRRNQWVISPKMETPVLDFTSQESEYGYGRGMWSGYGVDDKSKNISFGIERTFKGADEPAGAGDLLDLCFNEAEQKNIGKLAETKEISEAIVAIPYYFEQISNEPERGLRVPPATTEVIGKNFFAIDTTLFDTINAQETRIKNTSPGAYRLYLSETGGTHIDSQSISKMIRKMNDYIIPPELDFVTYNEGRKRIKPFVMYFFEFNHTLSKQDLSDIWQGVMPQISRVGELSSNVDDNVFTHPLGVNEFFGGKQIPSDVRWMVFKVKKRANHDYYKLTATTKDDERFDTQFSVNGKPLPYSYNWPYDYFSLVELAQIEASNESDEAERARQTQIQRLAGATGVGSI